MKRSWPLWECILWRNILRRSYIDREAEEEKLKLNRRPLWSEEKMKRSLTCVNEREEKLRENSTRRKKLMKTLSQCLRENEEEEMTLFSLPAEELFEKPLKAEGAETRNSNTILQLHDVKAEGCINPADYRKYRSYEKNLLNAGGRKYEENENLWNIHHTIQSIWPLAQLKAIQRKPLKLEEKHRENWKKAL